MPRPSLANAISGREATILIHEMNVFKVTGTQKGMTCVRNYKMTIHK